MSSTKRDRSIPRLEELSPFSVIKIFKFIQKLVEDKNLDLEFFNSREQLFNAEELYFLDSYIESYLFSSDSKSYFNNWLKNQEQYLDSPELFDSFSKYMTSLEENLLQIKKNIKLNKRKRLSDNKSMKNSSTHDKLLVPITPGKIVLIIPFKESEEDPLYIPSEVKTFKQFVIETLNTVLSEEDSLSFFYNSFSIYPFFSYSPPDLLNLKVVNKADLGEAILKIWKRYKSKFFKKDWLVRARTSNIEKLKEKLKEENKTPDEIEVLIKEFMSSAYYNLKVRDFKQANKVDFMKALYNSFPYIRVGYLKAKKQNPSIQIEEYLYSKTSSTIG